MTLFIRLLDSPVDEKGSQLREAIHHGKNSCYVVEPSAFNRVPGSPFAYWAVSSALNCYRDLPPVTSCQMRPLSTNQLSDDPRYARLWWEPGNAGPEKWIAWAKGRPYSPFHYDTQTVVRWNPSRGTYTGFIGTKDRPLEKPASADWFFRPGLTWPRRTDRLSVSILPKGCIFGNKGPTIFEDNDDETRLLAYCGILNSKTFKYLLGLQLARAELAQSFEVGLLQVAPVPNLSDDASQEMAELVRRVWLLKYRLDTIRETSHAFTLPAPILIRVSGFDQKSIESEIALIHSKIDETAFVLYQISAEDRAAVEAWSEGNTSSDGTEQSITDEDELAEEVTNNAEAILAWTFGVAIGRFDVRLATGERGLPKEPEPFDALPAKCPAMLSDADTSQPRSGGILVDDQGSADDLTSIVCGVLDKINIAQENDFASEAIRHWFAKSYFSLHIKMYSKSRRKAPIYWQFATPSSRYSIWLYVHAMGKDTLLRVQNDFVAPKLAHEQRQLETLRGEAATPTATQSKDIETQEEFVGELQTLLEELKRVAPLWDPDLDDGIIINSAPLWRLFPQSRGWQRDVRDTWDALCRGEYDWAHLAMRLWPDRVVAKCAQDRSLAIAHGLEKNFWFEDEEGKWQPYEIPQRSVADLIQQRTSTAVSAALKSLLAAPEAASGGKRGRKAKAA